MTKKRFINKGKDIFHYGEWWCSAGGEHCADVIATALNEIMDKNAQLKKENKEYIRGLELKKVECQSWASDVRELREQNYQLEKENKQLAHDTTVLIKVNQDYRRENKKLNALCVEYGFEMGKLEEENEQLKTIRSDLISELDIVQNELNIAINKGFAPSTSYKNYMASKTTEYDKFWENKIKTYNNTLKELKE